MVWINIKEDIIDKLKEHIANSFLQLNCVINNDIWSSIINF